MRSLGGRLFAASLAAVVLLDIGRSYHARRGSAVPAIAWPAASGQVDWPPGSTLPADATPGQVVYARHCAVCHGVAGRGDGPAAAMLRPRPRDFTSGVFKLKSVEGNAPPLLDDVRRSIRHGVAGTAMPAWGDLLSDEEIDAVAEHIRNLGPSRPWSVEASPVDHGALAAASVERGRQAYADLGCAVCHGQQLRGDGPSAPDLRDVWKQPVAARDLTAPWSYRWGTDRATVYRWIAYGVSGTPMPGYLDASDPQQIADVVAYLESEARPPPWRRGEAVWRVGDESPARRGEYLVRTGMCGLCHTPVDEGGVPRVETHYLAGGMRIAAGAHGVFFSANLTPDEETGLGGRSLEEIAAALRTGHGRKRRLSFWAMPWIIYGSLLPEDALAIAAYLKTLPPVRNRIPEPLHYGTLETVARKIFYPWPSLSPPQLVYGAGNFGGEDAPARSAPQGWLLGLQRLFVILAIAGWLLGRPLAARAHGGLPLARVILLLLVWAAIAFVERYPALAPMPAEPIVGGFAGSIPEVPSDEGGADPIALRGRYLFAVSSCAFCHGGDGSGGNKINWRAFGTVWSANLTPHASGLGAWSDDEILRLLRSGVRRDGRQVHWQAMPWDSFSGYSDEDLWSLVRFMRALPPLEREVPAALPPRAGDCDSYTFWLLRGSETGGCDS